MNIRKFYSFIAVFMIAAVAVAFMPADEAFAESKIKLSKCRITLSKTEFTYDGKAKCPKVTVKYKGKTVKKKGNYSLRYYSTSGPGTARIVVKGKGKYTGTVTKKYKVNVGKVTGLCATYNGVDPKSSSSAISLSWKKPIKCSSYKITVKKDGKSFGEGTYTTKNTSFTLKNLKGSGTFEFAVSARAGSKNVCSGAAYVSKKAALDTLTLSKPSASVVSKGYRRMDLSWKAVSNAQGYYIKETNGSTGKSTTTTVNSGTQTYMSFYDKTKGTSYSYSVQAFAKDQAGRTVKSSWSSVVSAKAAGTIYGHAKTGDPAYKPGDQSGSEVAFGNWSYSSTSSSWKHWTYMARFKDPALAEKCAKLMADGCNNNNIGYGKYPANLTLTNIAKKNGFNVAGITTKCDTDCVCLVSVCINGAIGKWTVDNLKPRETMYAKLTSSTMKKYLTVYSDSKYLKTDAYLQRGDILWTDSGNHTCIVQ